MIKRLLRGTSRVTPKELDQQTDAVNAVLKRDSAKMNSIVNYLEMRKDQNGFGADFEIALRPKGAYYGCD